MGLMLVSTVILPMLKKCGMTEYKILIFSLILSMISSILMCMVLIFKQLFLIFVAGLVLGIAYLSFVAYNSLLTAYCDESEKGIGLGVMFMCRGVSSIIAPFGF